MVPLPSAISPESLNIGGIPLSRLLKTDQAFPVTVLKPWGRTRRSVKRTVPLMNPHGIQVDIRPGGFCCQ